MQSAPFDSAQDKRPHYRNLRSDSVTAETHTIRKPSVLTWIVFGLLGLIVCYLLGQFVVHPEKYQWDFRVYYYAASAHQAGIDPYDARAVQNFAPACPLLPFAYPPPLLRVFGLFTRLPYETAYYIWLAIKLTALAGLLLLWRRSLFRDEPLIPYALFLMLGFSSTIYMDLIAGNTSIIEQALLWTGIVFLLRERHTLFVVFVIAASAFKLLPIAFLSLLVLVPAQTRWRHLAVGTGMYAGIVLAAYLAEPDLFGRFLESAWGIKERGLDGNPSLLSFLQDVADSMTLARWAPVAVYSAAAVAILWVSLRTWRMLRLHPGPDSLLAAVMLAAPTYALIVPRFKTYSFILLLPAAWYVIKRSSHLSALPFLLVLFAIPVYPRLPNEYPIHTFGKFVWFYYPLILAFMLWGLMAWQLRPTSGVKACQTLRPSRDA